MWVLGLTGGIGSGKTTVSDLFAAHGITIVDADVVARHIMDPGSAALDAVKAHFGQAALQADGTLNRAWLRARVFSDPAEKQWLNQLTHPLIRQEILAQLQSAQSPYVILSAPLLVENKLTELCDRVLVVDVSEDTQRTRTLQRDKVTRHTTKDQVEQIMAAQATRQQRLDAADDVIDNDGDIALLPAQVAALHARYLTLAHDQRQDA
ncbi:dephospho-CoA kinase [Pseudidiomarina salilacus]|uniref:dephospho-CoA kinase n=1 Tax=Pseudidiomarina salilacus TaxID=3384452 RepID=UPI0039853ADE